MKKIVLIIISAMIIFGLCGCGEYPCVLVENGPFQSSRHISMGSPYEYNGFDLRHTKEGDDLVLHFKRR